MICFIDNFKKAAKKKLLTIVVRIVPSAESKPFLRDFTPSVICGGTFLAIVNS